MHLSVSTRQYAGHAVVELSGELDMDDADQLHRHLHTELDAAERGTVVDLSALTFIDSTGLSALINAREHAQMLGKALFLTQPQPTVAKVFTITGMDSVFDIVATPDAAFAERPGDSSTATG